MEQRELVSARLLFVSLLDHSQGIDLSEMDWAHNLQKSWKTDTTRRLITPTSCRNAVPHNTTQAKTIF